MTLALRRTVFADGKRRADDYEVRYNGRTVGRILRLRSTGRELWLWTQIGIRAPSYGPNGGVADTLDEAKATFRAAGEARALAETDAEHDMHECCRAAAGWHPRYSG
jgi:hypothetical protein